MTRMGRYGSDNVDAEEELNVLANLEKNRQRQRSRSPRRRE